MNVVPIVDLCHFGVPDWIGDFQNEDLPRLFAGYAEQLAGDRPFVTALKHIVKANVLAMHAIIGERPDSIFVQSESSEQYHAESPEAARAAGKLDAMRFLSLDLNYGRRVSSEMYTYLMGAGCCPRLQLPVLRATDLCRACRLSGTAHAARCCRR